MRKRTSRIFPDGKTECNEVYAPFNDGWQYCDAIYKCDENGVMTCLWKKISETSLTNVFFETVSNAKDDYYAIIQYEETRGFRYGIAYKKDKKWILIKDLGYANITKYVLYATTKGFVIQMIETPYGGTSVQKGLFRGWYYGLKEEINNKTFELHELELLDDGDLLFDSYAESIRLQPKLNMYKNTLVPFDEWSGGMTTSYITKKYKYEYEKVIWEEKNAEGIIIEKEEYKWRIYDWKGNEITKPEDPSEYPPTEKTSMVRGVDSGYDSDNITYFIEKGKQIHVTGNELAAMVGKMFPDVGVNCSRVSVILVRDNIARDVRYFDENGKTLQSTQHTCLFGDNQRIMVVSSGYHSKLTETSREEVKNIGIYQIQGTEAEGYIFDIREEDPRPFSPSLSGDPPSIRNYGLFYNGGDKIYALIYSDWTEKNKYGYPKLYVGIYDAEKGIYSFSNFSSEEYEYPFSFGGIIPGEDEDYIVISKLTDNYHARKYAYDSQGNVVRVPVYRDIE